MLSAAEAVARVLEGAATLAPEDVPLEQCLGRTLAVDIRAPMDVPPWANSAVDGYAVVGDAVRSATRAAPVVLDVIEHVRAGTFPTRRVDRHTAVQIMTGAPVPDGADTVVRIEETDGGAVRVSVHDGRDAGRHVRPRAQDVARDAVALRAGDAISPAGVGVLAMLGVTSVTVVRVPRVGVLATGDELVPIERFGDALAGRRIVSASSYALHALLRELGCEVVDLGIAGDSSEALRSALSTVPGTCDVLLTTGGVSVGAHDLVRPVLEELGASLDFWRARIRPGGPIGSGGIGDVRWLGLPGNPVSTLVTFELFARPLLLRMMGRKRLFRAPVRVVVDDDAATPGRLMHFLRVALTSRETGLHASLTGSQGSNLLVPMARADALLMVPEECDAVRAGDSLLAMPLRDSTLDIETLVA